MSDNTKNESHGSGWHHLLIDGDEEVNLAKFAKYLNSEGKLEFPRYLGTEEPGGPGIVLRIDGLEEQKGSSPAAS
jgi:hypothetical protein